MGSLATIVVVPRESFSRSLPGLESVFAHTRQPFELVYVDANSPAAIGRRLARAALERDFTLAGSTHFLSPNEARNLGFARVRTKYTVFLGNDVFVTDGWLESLVECAEETGAAFVGGVSCWGEHGAPVVYCAGGESHLVDRDDGTRGLHDVHHGANRPLVEERLALRRAPSEAAVFHCMLVRSEVVDRLGGMDEDLYVLDHVDWCLRGRSAKRAADGSSPDRSCGIHRPRRRARPTCPTACCVGVGPGSSRAVRVSATSGASIRRIRVSAAT